jgi:adenosylcobinamide-GDP ribazoletransferase
MLSQIANAIRFLTIIPLPGTSSQDHNFNLSITRSMRWFPLVGLLIGLITVLVGWGAGWLWNPFSRAALMVVISAIITSGLHLDGLSDTFDATMSWRNRERMLEIMKDSRIGAMGAMALIAIFILKVAFLTSAGENWWRAALMATTIARWADLYGIAFYPPARGGGLGKSFHDLLKRSDIALATAQMMLIAAVVLCIGREPALWGLVLFHGGISIGLVWLISRWLCRRWVKQLGGLTGDTYGALSEIAEVVVFAAISVQWGS